MQTLAAVLTTAGLAALLNASNTGLGAAITHMAFGDGHGAGYTPQAGQLGLANEVVRIGVGGGARIGNAEIEVQALLDTGPSFWIREVGFVLDDGTMLAVWSDPITPLAYKTQGVPLAVSYSLALEGAPADAVTVNVTGPSVNLTITAPIAQISAEIIRLQRRAVATENARLIPQIQSTWR